MDEGYDWDVQWFDNFCNKFYTARNRNMEVAPSLFCNSAHFYDISRDNTRDNTHDNTHNNTRDNIP